MLFILYRRQSRHSHRERNFRYGTGSFPGAPTHKGAQHSGTSVLYTPTLQQSPTAPHFSAAQTAGALPHGDAAQGLYSERDHEKTPRALWTPSLLHSRSSTPQSTNTNTRLLPALPASTHGHAALSTLSEEHGAVLGPAPQRPKRTGDNILDWLGSGIGWERNTQSKRDDGNSSKTNFLQV